MSTAALTSVRTATARAGTDRAPAGSARLGRPSGGQVRGQARTGASADRGIRLTARGRRLVRLLVLATATVVLAVGLVLAWMTVAATVAPGASAGDGGAGVASGAGVGTEVDAGAGAGAGRTVAVVVAPGDTLWQLAGEHAPDRDPRSVVADIVALNDLGSTGVQAGARVLVPLG